MKASTQQLREIFQNMKLFHGVDRLKDDENLFTAGALDSLIMIQYVLAVEDYYKLRLANEDINYDNFQSFAALSKLLHSKYKID